LMRLVIENMMASNKCFSFSLLFSLLDILLKFQTDISSSLVLYSLCPIFYIKGFLSIESDVVVALPVYIQR
jgi:hypothetical protein